MSEATKVPMTGHTSQDTAFVVDSYPYGFTLRCKIRYWLETHPKKGTRFMSQTTNPKKQGEVWNKPKASTYALITAAMYIDEKGHVQWDAISPYRDHADALAFALAFGGGCSPKRFQAWVQMQVRDCEKLASGAKEWVITVNGVEKPRSEEEKEAEKKRYEADLAGWRVVADALEEKEGPAKKAEEVAA